VGGGSPMDVGKSVGILAQSRLGRGLLGNRQSEKQRVPVICLPTTSGTSAEITDVAVLSEPEKKTKVGLRSPRSLPQWQFSTPCSPLRSPGSDRESGLMPGHALSPMFA